MPVSGQCIPFDVSSLDITPLIIRGQQFYHTIANVFKTNEAKLNGRDLIDLLPDEYPCDLPIGLMPWFDRFRENPKQMRCCRI